MMLQAPVAHFDLQPSELTRPFWEACRNGRLTFQRCTRCGRAFFRPEIFCPHCRSTDWAWEDSFGEGELYSFSVVHRPPTAAFSAPFVFAQIDVDEGFSMFSNLVGSPAEAPRIGMRVKVLFHRVSDELTLPYFEAA